MKNKAIFIIGPTATGKTSLGIDIAKHINSEIISIDSRQVYTGLDIGTGKDLDEFGKGDNAIKYHLIDIANPITDEYNLHTFIHDAVAAMKKLWREDKIPVLVGGTSLYINALISGYDLSNCPPNPELRELLYKKSDAELIDELQKYPEAFANTDKSTIKRVVRAIEVAQSQESETTVEIPKFESLILAPYYHRTICHQRVEQRLDARIEEGMIEEVQKLHNQGVSWDKLDWFGLEYRYVSQFLRAEISKKEMRDQLFIKIRQFLKAQVVWLRKMEREGKTIYWLPEGNRANAFMLTDRFINDKILPESSIKISEIHYGPKQ